VASPRRKRRYPGEVVRLVDAKSWAGIADKVNHARQLMKTKRVSIIHNKVKTGASCMGHRFIKNLANLINNPIKPVRLKI